MHSSNCFWSVECTAVKNIETAWYHLPPLCPRPRSHKRLFRLVRYGADPRDPLTREALARAEGRAIEGVSQVDLARDAEAIEQLMEIVLQKEKEDKEKSKVGVGGACHTYIHAFYFYFFSLADLMGGWVGGLVGRSRGDYWRSWSLFILHALEQSAFLLICKMPARAPSFRVLVFFVEPACGRTSFFAFSPAAGSGKVTERSLCTAFLCTNCAHLIVALAFASGSKSGHG